MEESTRQKKYARLIQKELGDIFQHHIKEITQNAFITITHTKITPDLSLARVKLSFFMVKDPEGLLANIIDNLKHIRHILGLRIGKQVRIVPNLEFYIDETEEAASKMDKLIESLNIPPAPDSDDDNDSIYRK